MTDSFPQQSAVQPVPQRAVSAPPAKSVPRSVANRPLNRTFAAYASAGLSEWMMWVAVMVYAYEQGGAQVAGFASIGLLLPAAISAPLAGRAADGAHPNRVFVWSIVVTGLSLGVAAAASTTDNAVMLVTAAIGIAVASLAVMRPAASVVVPSLVRTARELTTANVRFSLADNISALGGPALTALLIRLSGPTAALTAGCALNFVGVCLTLSLARRTEAAEPVPSTSGEPLRPLQAMAQAWRSFDGRAAGRSVLFVCGGQYVLIGCLELMLVVIANDRLDMDRSGPAVLSALFGAGAVIAGLAASRMVTDRPLSPLVLISACVLTIGLLAISVKPSLAVVAVVLPVIGFSRSLLNLSSRMLLQRSAPGEQVASVFALLEVVMVVAQIVGALVAQAAIAAAGVRAGWASIGLILALCVGVTARSIRRADADADTPLVTIRLLRAHPVFAPLQPRALEAVARSAVDLPVEKGSTVITQGEVGDRFYVVADGALDVIMDGDYVRTARRGSSFGEVALLADVPRTATVKATADSHLVAIDRVPFLTAVTGHDGSRRAAWTAVRSMELPNRVVVEPTE